jgi:hypothetical protein
VAGSAARVAEAPAPAAQALLLVPRLARRARHWGTGSPVWRHARYRGGGRRCPCRPAHSLIWSALIWSALIWSALIWSALIWSALIWSAHTHDMAAHPAGGDPGCADRNLPARQESPGVKR